MPKADYVGLKAIFVNLGSFPRIPPDEYNAHNGPGAMENVLRRLNSSQS